MNEYFDVAHAYGGTIVNLSAYTKSYVNPLAVDLFNIDQAGIQEVIAEKSQFLLSLCDQLAPVAMLVMMEAIQSRIIENGKKGRATWLYIDECHVLLKSDYSATYLQQLWKKVRKQGGLCTGISQNVTDLLQNDIAAILITNSEFIVLLKQSNIDSVRLAETIGVTDAQLEFVKNSQSGTAIKAFGRMADKKLNNR